MFIINLEQISTRVGTITSISEKVGSIRREIVDMGQVYYEPLCFAHIEQSLWVEVRTARIYYEN